MLIFRRHKGLFAATAVLIAAACAGLYRQSADEPAVTLAAVGDVLLARGVGRQIQRHGVDYPYDNVRSIISSADIAFCNLECPVSDKGYPRRTRFLFRASPRTLAGLKRAGFDVVSLANNHTFDYGRDALTDTMQRLHKTGIKYSGAGMNRKEALKPAVIHVKGLKIGFLSYTDLPAQGEVPLPDLPGIARVHPDTLADEITGAKKTVDTLVVSFHWGVEYRITPTNRQITLAHKAIDAGADVILGHHPHVLQKTEVYREKPIVYSMGSFIFDPPRWPGTRKTAIYTIELKRSTAKLVRTIPVKIDNCRPTMQ